MAIILTPRPEPHQTRPYHLALDLWRQVESLACAAPLDPLTDRLEEDAVGAVLALSRAGETASERERRRLRRKALSDLVDASAVLEFLRLRDPLSGAVYRRVRRLALRNLRVLVPRARA